MGRPGPRAPASVHIVGLAQSGRAVMGSCAMLRPLTDSRRLIVRQSMSTSQSPNELLIRHAPPRHSSDVGRESIAGRTIGHRPSICAPQQEKLRHLNGTAPRTGCVECVRARLDNMDIRRQTRLAPGVQVFLRAVCGQNVYRNTRQSPSLRSQSAVCEPRNPL